MENKTVAYSVIGSVISMVITLFAYQLLYLNDKMDFKMDEKFKAKEYVTSEQLANKVKEAVLDEREIQAETKTASLSRGLADEMGWERTEVKTKAAKVFRFGYEQMALQEERQIIWKELVNTKYIGVIYKLNQVGIGVFYYRDITGDFLIHYEIVNGNRKHYWQGTDMVKHQLIERDKIRTIVIE